MLISQLTRWSSLLVFVAYGGFGAPAVAQSISLTPLAATVQVEGRELAYPFAGGLNNPQVANPDFNGDGLPDLYIFDKTGNASLVFIREGETYRYAPEFVSSLPAGLVHWVSATDYDGDGITDLFTAHEFLAGIRVFKGYRDAGDTLRFTRVGLPNETNVLEYPIGATSRTQIYVSLIDYPAFTDVDCDGDLDILTFNPSGGYLELFRNQSVERGYGRDSLIFIRTDGCYGGFYESGLSVEVDLPDGPDDCANGLWEEPQGSPRHAGSTILAFDANADGIKDIVLGDLSFDLLNLLVLDGECGDVFATQQITPYPNTSTPLDVAQFPAAFYLDVDFDAIPDLLAAPNLPTNAEDVNVLWQYHNANTADSARFEFVTESFLVGDMIDLGTGARPVPFDYNADGKPDLVVGNYSRYTGGISRESRLLLFENTSSGGELRFTLVDDDYLGMTPLSTSTFGFHPAFGDLDGDGDLDALVGEETGTLFYVENIAGPNATAQWAPPVANYMDIDVGQTSVPQIIDLNRDGKPDLIVGERSGNVNFFPNVGLVGTPFFEPDPGQAPNVEILGGLDARVPGITVGYSSPWFVEVDGAFQLFMGIQNGPVERYGDIDDNLDGVFTLLEERVGGLDPGIRSHPALADWNQDGFLELLIGNHRGGLQLYRTELPASPTVAVAEPEDGPSLLAYPNPFSRHLTLDHLPSDWRELSLYSLDGRLLRNWSGDGEPRRTFSLAELPRGVYVLRLRATGGSRVLRVVKN